MKNLYLFFSVILLMSCCGPEKKPLPEQEPEFFYGELLYENNFSSGKQLENWIMEGPGILKFEDGWMNMYTPDEEYHHVFWCPQDFPDSFIAEWEAQNLEPDAGLCIIFFAAKGLNGEDIFDQELPERDGTFSRYTKGKINNYHISYYANNPVYEKGRGTANLRKNRGFKLVQTGKIGIPIDSRDIHKIKLVKDKAHIVMWVDNKRIIDWTDSISEYGPIHGSGKIGFRQMKWTNFKYRNFKVWNLGSSMQ